MKYLMSIAWRTLPYISIDEILTLLDNSKYKKYVSGLELASPDLLDMEKALQYMIKNNMVFRCHIPKLKDDEVFSYLDTVGYLAEKYKTYLSITIHSKEDDNFDKTLELTTSYLSSLVSYIKENNLRILLSLENLNFHHDHRRINIAELDEFFREFPDIKFTYDIGHDIYDNNTPSTLSNLQVNLLENIHLHDVKNMKDHCLINTESEHILELKQAMNNLKELNFSNTIVIEEAVSLYEGDTYTEKISKYLESFSKLDDLFFNS